MPVLTPRQRRNFGIGGLVLSAVAALTLFAGPKRDGIQRAQASIDQYRSNPTASTSGGMLPTFTTIKVDFPSRLGLHSTAVIELVYARYIADGGTEFVMQNGEMKIVEGKPRPGSPIPKLSRAVRVTLESSALSIAPASITTPEAISLPHTFRWTVTPKQEGTNHYALLDLNELISPSTDGRIFGTTEIRIGGKPSELKGGSQLVLPFAVVDDQPLLDKALNALAGLPALIGFIISYPLVVDWLKRRLRKANATAVSSPADRAASSHSTPPAVK